MEKARAKSTQSVIELASCLVNSQLFLDNTHSCFTKMRKKIVILSSYIKIIVHVGTWVEAIFFYLQIACG